MTFSYSRADEGMWLVKMLDKQFYSHMKSKGLKLKAGELYNNERGALSDAIIAIDGGSCSGSIISAEGLMITNHHCAYGDIHALSTPEKNYLEDGFWAMNKEQEVNIKGKTVTFLRKIVDVTEETKAIIDSLDKAGPRGLFFMNKVSGILEERYKGTPYELFLSSLWRGSKYYLYYYETYKDVRLVGAPPVSVGAFGGETDNWGWPQHKGDFAIYRVYADKDGKPADYSPENVPLNAGRYLKVSAKGYKKDDFTMILGYPGTTNRYMSSFEMKEKFDILNPISYSVRRAKLDVWEKYMEMDPAIRLKYADKYFGISNYTDYAKWENICLERYKVEDVLKEKEKELAQWITSDSERSKKYGSVLEDLEKAYRLKAEITKNREYFRESMVRGAEYIGLAQRVNGTMSSLKRKNIDSVKSGDKVLEELVNANAMPLFRGSVADADREVFKKMLNFYVKEVPSSFFWGGFSEMLASFNGNTDKLADYIYDNSIVTDSTRFKNFLSVRRPLDDYLNDPVMKIVETIRIRDYNQTEDKILDEAKINLSAARGNYVRALYEMEMEKGKLNYPDANSTMRLTYGEVGPIEPADAVYYHYQTTSKGIEEKNKPKDYEFAMKPGVLDLLKKGDWGRWGEKGRLYINFMTDNDITGGNSGSAVMNAKGELIGLAFDGNRESMSGDIYFHNSKLCKTLILSIVYKIQKTIVFEKFSILLNNRRL